MSLARNLQILYQLPQFQKSYCVESTVPNQRQMMFELPQCQDPELVTPVELLDNVGDVVAIRTSPTESTVAERLPLESKKIHYFQQHQRLYWYWLLKHGIYCCRWSGQPTTRAVGSRLSDEL